jgi:hypothetical protein
MTNRSVSHIEIPANGRADLAKFYAKIFGWKTQAMDDKGIPYTVWQSGNIRGGFPNVDDNNKPGDVIVYIDSDDIEADLKKIEAMAARRSKARSKSRRWLVRAVRRPNWQPVGIVYRSTQGLRALGRAIMTPHEIQDSVFRKPQQTNHKKMTSKSERCLQQDMVRKEIGEE